MHRRPDRPWWLEDPDLDEARTVDLLLDSLTDVGWTVVEREVRGTHPISGQDLRVDVVVDAPEPDQWKTPRWALECKRALLPDDATDHAARVVQAVDYR